MQRDEIVATAIRASQEKGAATLSMRGLADELGVTPMALYGHVADKDEILDEILDHVLARDAPPARFQGDWRAWMVDFAERLHHVLVHEPPLLDRYCRRPVGVPAALVRMEAAFEVLTSVGFNDERATEIYATVHTFTVGFTALEVARQTNVAAAPARRSSTNPNPGSAQYWPAFFASLSPEKYPHLSRLHPDLAEFTSERQFRRALEVLLDGFDTLREQDTSKPPSE